MRSELTTSEVSSLQSVESLFYFYFFVVKLLRNNWFIAIAMAEVIGREHVFVTFMNFPINFC